MAKHRRRRRRRNSSRFSADDNRRLLARPLAKQLAGQFAVLRSRDLNQLGRNDDKLSAHGQRGCTHKHKHKHTPNNTDHKRPVMDLWSSWLRKSIVQQEGFLLLLLLLAGAFARSLSPSLLLRQNERQSRKPVAETKLPD